MISGDTVFIYRSVAVDITIVPKDSTVCLRLSDLLYAVYRTTAITVVDFSVQVAGVEPAEGVRPFKR